MTAYSTTVAASVFLVLANVVATAYREPPYIHPVMLLFGNARLKYLVPTVVLTDLFLSPSNAGGHIAHLGGAR